MGARMPETKSEMANTTGLGWGTGQGKVLAGTRLTQV